VKPRFVPEREQVERLASRLADSLPGDLQALRDELEKNFRTVLAQGLAKLDLVTREEFEVQEAVLARTREKLEALERKVREFES
jgi:BMFP domain-containing protein YqiC